MGMAGVCWADPQPQALWTWLKLKATYLASYSSDIVGQVVWVPWIEKEPQMI